MYRRRVSASTHVWVPDAATRAAGERAQVPYRFAVNVPPGEQWAPTPALVALKEEIVRAWPGISSGGMVRPSDRRNGGHDPHLEGNAVDAMVVNDANRPANGDALANFLVRNADYLGIQYVLWSMYEWSASRNGPRWDRYTGSQDHRDHVHFELSPDARTWPADVMRARVRSALTAWSSPPASTGHVAAYVVGGVAFVAALAVVFGKRR